MVEDVVDGAVKVAEDIVGDVDKEFDDAVESAAQ